MLKAVTPAVEQHVKQTWNKGLEATIPEEPVFIEQYSPPNDVINEFEGRRNELDKVLPAGKKLQTIHAFFYPQKEKVEKLLLDGFPSSYGNTKLAFSKDPSQALKEGFGSGNKIFLCKVTLGREGVDFTVVRGKYVVENLRQVLVGFVITFAKAGESVSLTPTIAQHLQDKRVPPKAAGGQDDIVFEEAVVVHYDDDPNKRDVFGEPSHELSAEEARLLKHVSHKAPHKK